MRTPNMGFCISKEAAAARSQSKKIDQAIRHENQQTQYDVKLLLLGTGESGKSTILKQMKIAYNQDYTEEERLQFRGVVQANTLDAMTTILRAMGTLKINFERLSMMDEARRFFEKTSAIESGEVIIDVAEMMKDLWKDGGVRECFKRASEYQLSDSAEYFLNDLDRIACRNYIPTTQDVLRVRTRTLGIIEANFVYKDINFRVFDVGGQRSIRRKWIHLFDNVTAVIFVVALSEYDQVLEEDSDMNRMRESMKLFESITNNKFFENTSIILFLNKKDIFEIKILTVPITVCFPDYDGDHSFEDSTNFIRRKFEGLNRISQKREIYTHITCATNSENMQFVFSAVTDTIIRTNLMDYGIA